ncbi:MAG: AAA family ATPase [Nanoarchaeota archaeon]|nr:AAA family ATPase [Nanoarchaeota archaeon]MBU1103929.1 AAA family ATPase [Nanoarchaeota archaeon]
MAVEDEQNKEQLINYVFGKLAEAPQFVENQLKVKGSYLPHRRVYSRLKMHVDDFLLGEGMGGKISNRLIILPGLRGVGKTTLLFQLYKYLKEVKKIEQDRILYFSTDELKAYLGRGILEVIDVFIKEIHKTTFTSLDKEIFIFIDESHFDPKWSEAAKIIFDKTKKIFLIFTGSSALNLELSVDAARRTKKEIVFPLNFGEYISLRHNVYPPKGMAEGIRELIFKGDDAAVENAQRKEAELNRNLVKVGRPIDKEWEDFLCCIGFPIGLQMSQIEVHERLFSMIDRVIEKDVFSIQAFSTDTRNVISRILTFLALQKPGGTSDAKLSDRLKISPNTVRNILEVLEKTHLIFSVKPYGGAGKVVRKPWKYYFLSSSIIAAIRFKLGAYNPRDREMLGVLAENMAASYFFRMKETVNLPVGMFYDSEPNGADFLLQDAEENIIPLEIGIGKKDKSQVRNSINRYKSKYGIVVSNVQKITKQDNVIFIPLTTFSFV